VPFWSPTFSVTDERLAEEPEELELELVPDPGELLELEQPAAASAAITSVVAARSLGRWIIHSP
jgi:hypothetical protein